MLSHVAGGAFALLRRVGEEADPEEGGDSSQQEVFSSWALFISIALLIISFFTSYILQQKKVQAVHETVISIFAGMTVGLILRVTVGTNIRQLVSFDFQIFFNLLLPPIILNSGYELHQANFFRNIGTILTFAFAGTFLSAVVIGTLLWLYTRIPLEGLDMSFVDAISVGATLSATDPVTILAIFNTYKVDPKLYTIIFGESILNDAIAIVIFETAQKYKSGAAGTYGLFSFFEGVGIFLLTFFVSLLIGVMVGVGTALVLKFTYVRRYPQIESCLIVLIAYASYFFSQAIKMSGIVSLLFCGITLKHYAYFNMSRRSQLSTKYIFQVLAQLSENFIFIYLGLTLFSDTDLQFQPLLIMVTVMAVCAARWVAVFPLSRAINWFIRYRARRRGREVNDELPYNYQAMLFWAGLRGAVGVALAALLTGENQYALKATVLVVVVLTVIIFGGTTARMLEILGIRTGVVEEVDSDDEFDIEAVPGGSYYKRSGSGIGYNPRREGSVALNHLDVANGKRDGPERGSYVSGHHSPAGASRPTNLPRRSSRAAQTSRDEFERNDILAQNGNMTDSDLGSDIDTSDLPPPARQSPRRRSSPLLTPSGSSQEEDIFSYPTSGQREQGPVSASAAIKQLFTAQDPQALFRQLDEDYIKPHLLVDGSAGDPRGRMHGDDAAGPS
ncbi:Sodium/hydrogen exchanger family-domain-containing protein [Pseudomassariella vexata]|uniref:Sodium/hydrogen exchanger n=1 Tax=Pseudomassariella vexata TaxID=1141098 RepID=A0A1Y2EEH8_9PEZI|nr:Sodium/hydrogen exchanger family-domain-containing protein [Pseudomassariella vexata]ORY69978.1 Sodium/hydrogen exchanger family-domain-containing protein [Pseudomassariella vexata]